MKFDHGIASQQRQLYFFLTKNRSITVITLLCVFFVGQACTRGNISAESTTVESSEKLDPQVASLPQTVAVNAVEASLTDTSTNFLPIVSSSVKMLNEQTIFAEDLNQNWQDWSWNTTADFADQAEHHSGEIGLAVTYTAAWAAFYLHSNAFIDTKEYDLLRFWIHGGNQGQQRTRVVLADEGNGFLTESYEVVAQANSWQLVEIPLNTLGAPMYISGIAWQDTVGSAQPTFYIDDLALIDLDLPATPTPAPVTGPELTVDISAERYPINPDIYGINYASESLAQELRLPVRRWGGNATTRYNWQNDTANRASDWYFENIPEENSDPSQLPFGSAADQFIGQDRRTGTKTILTMPMIGWTPKSRERTCGFSMTKYGPQQYSDAWQPDCGNGVDPSGNVITGNDPTDTSRAIDPTFVQAWIEHLVGQFGPAAEGGVAFYNLDNEPMLWHHTHRDVHPTPVGYDELRDRTIAYAAAIKAADPTAKTLGPVLWGWTAYAYSALDSQNGGSWWNSAPDRKAHGDLSLVAWYLQEMQRYEEQHGVRLLDYLDLHNYPQATGVALGGVGDSTTRALRLRSTRSLWDPTYRDESWIDESVRLIPRMHDWVEQYYPGTKLALTEYNWGGLEHINGALAQADILGIFGREQLDLATLWAPLDDQDPFTFAFRIYRNYDGNNGSFGDIHLEADSTDQDQLAIYAAQRSQDGAVTLVIINKTASRFMSPISLTGIETIERIERFRYSSEDLHTIQKLSDRPITEGSLLEDFPGNSITLMILH